MDLACISQHSQSCIPLHSSRYNVTVDALPDFLKRRHVFEAYIVPVTVFTLKSAKNDIKLKHFNVNHIPKHSNDMFQAFLHLSATGK